ncbi:MAG: Heme chaperone HemW [Syntrophus sp. SKADARSKE-3]|nr:Heme chaperone HemW [Syntrophus sp. SKADARSKE-3]
MIDVPPSPTAGLYIHVPFCKGKCPYCHFYSEPHIERIEEYVTALLKEMSLYRDSFHDFDTLYFGGGTPSLLQIDQFGSIINGVHQYFKLQSDSEITVEVNPADHDLSWYRGLKALGINRINIGIQSFSDDTLRFLGRRHTACESVDAIETANRAGFTNIGLDLIYGIPGQTLKAWRETIDRALDLKPSHLSCYELTIEADTPFEKRKLAGAFSLPDENSQWTFLTFTSEYLEKAGYIHYEISNFALNSASMSRHNRIYWNRIPYLGLGPAAHSYLGTTRWCNHASVIRYINDLSQGILPLSFTEQLSKDQILLEDIFLRMRMPEGIELETFNERHGIDFLLKNVTMIDQCISEGLLLHNNGRLSPTLKGLSIADRLAFTLYDSLTGR